MTQYSPILAIIVVLGLACDVFSFVPPVQARRALGKSKAAHVTSALGHRQWVRGCCMEMELELMQKVPNIQGKRLDVVDQEQGVYNYEFTIEAPGSSTQRLNHHITRAVREKSNFPNLKRGQVPPHLVLQTKKFVVEEVMNEGISTALETYELVGAGGDETDADILTDINELVMGFKPGRTLTFSCRIHAKAKPPDPENESSPAADEATSSTSSTSTVDDAATTGDNTRLPDITASTVDDSVLVDKAV